MAKKNKQPAAEPVQSKELIAEEELASADGDVNIVAKAWDFLSSMKLGIVLLLVLALVSIVGTIFPKNPVTGQQDFVKFYNNWFFRILMATLALNLLVCSLNRLRHITGTLRGPKPMVSDAFLRNLKTSDAFQIKEESGIVALRLQDILRRKGYRTFTDNTASKSYVAADRGRWGILGPYLSHISFFIMIVAILVKFSGFVGFEGDLAAKRVPPPAVPRISL